MLFILDESILFIDETNEKHISAIDSILSAHLHGYHFVFAKREVARKLQQIAKNNFSKKITAIINKIITDAIEYKQIADSIPTKIIVYIDINNKSIRKENESWWVPLEHYHGKAILDSAVIAEDIEDAEIFIKLAKIIKKDYAKGFSVSARPRAGGGSRTKRVLESHLASEISPCICITDSDRFHPSSAISDSALECKNITDRKLKVATTHILEARELENLIPESFYKKQYPGKNFHEIASTHLIKDIEHFKYLDMKKGLSLEWLQDRCKDTTLTKYWVTSKNYLERQVRKCTSCDINNLDDKCNCHTIPGYGKDIAKYFNAFINESIERDISKCLEETSDWMPPAKLTLYYSIAPTAERAF